MVVICPVLRKRTPEGRSIVGRGCVPARHNGTVRLDDLSADGLAADFLQRHVVAQASEVGLIVGPTSRGVPRVRVVGPRDVVRQLGGDSVDGGAMHGTGIGKHPTHRCGQ